MVATYWETNLERAHKDPILKHEKIEKGIEIRRGLDSIEGTLKG